MAEIHFEPLLWCFWHLPRLLGIPIIFIKMFPFLVFSYIASAMGFYKYIYHTAPIMEEGAATDCKIYELFPAEEIRADEIRKAA